MALQQDRIALDVLNVFAEGEGVEGAHFEAKCCWAHPLARILVEGDFFHPCSLLLHVFVHSDLLRVQGIHNVELLLAADP